MTENQRNYLADLAGQKGIRLSDTDNWSVSKASEEIERIKELPDAVFGVLSDNQVQEIDKQTESVLAELHKWGFTEAKR